jgi:hypothetical protein
MKKFFIYVYVLASSLISDKANAQQGFSVSIKGIPQFSLLDNKDDNNNSNYTQNTTFNASFGLGAGYNFTQNLGAGIDVLYSLQGQRYKLSGTEYNQKNDYIKVPVYFSYNTDHSKKVSFIAKLGPQVSFISSSKLDDKNGNTINGNTKDLYKTETFGAMILAGAQYKINNNLYLSTAWRFDYDFTNAEDDQNKAYARGRAKTNNMTSGLEVGLKYMFKN